MRSIASICLMIILLGPGPGCQESQTRTGPLPTEPGEPRVTLVHPKDAPRVKEGMDWQSFVAALKSKGWDTAECSMYPFVVSPEQENGTERIYLGPELEGGTVSTYLSPNRRVDLVVMWWHGKGDPRTVVRHFAFFEAEEGFWSEENLSRCIDRLFEMVSEKPGKR